MLLNAVRQYFKSDPTINRVLFRVLCAAMLTLTVLRIAVTLKDNFLVDLVCHLDATSALWRQLNPYDLRNLKWVDWNCPPIIFPGTFPLCAPWLPLGLEAAKFTHLALNFSAACWLACLFFKMTGIADWADYRQPNRKALLAAVMTFIFLNSTPTLMMFRHGQNTIFVTLLLALCLQVRAQWAGIVLFALAAVLKYTMLTVLAPALALKGKYRFCVASGMLFLLFALSPALRGHDLFKLYGDYSALVRQYITSGFNTYAESGYSMLNIGFFKFGLLNAAAKSALGLAIGYIVFRERRQSALGMNFLLAILCATMLFSYHRLHDIPLIMLILLAEFYFFMRAGDRVNLLLTGAFILFFAVPFSLIIKLSSLICRLPSVGRVFQTCHYQLANAEVFPLSAVVFLLLASHALLIYFFKPENVIFELGTVAGAKRQQR